MAFKTINDYPESTSPNGDWYVLVDDGTGCYKKVKLSNLPGGGSVPTTTSTTTTASAGTTTTTSTSTTTSTPSGSTSTSTSTTTSSTSTSTSTTSSTSSTTTLSCEMTDADAIAFIAATGITNCTIKNAINAFVIGMKADGLWTKMRAIYPFVGGTATTHKFNLKNPVDSDAAFRIVFGGGVVHDANGVTFNGVSGYGDTKFDIADFPSNTNMSQGVYVRSTVSPGDGGFEMGVYLSAVYQNFFWGASGRYYANTNTGFVTYPVTVGQPYGFISSIMNGTTYKSFKNGALTDTDTTPNDIPPIAGQNWFIGAANNGSGAATEFTDTNQAFTFLGETLSDGEMTNLYNRVQTMQTALGRQVV